jgi:NAD(P)-dependent dehydrogenase (short-subunit alcohol dehydrogenase family)
MIFLSYQLIKKKVMNTQKSVAITGAGSGLGLETALGFSAKGYAVYGTAFSQKEIDAINSMPAGTNISLYLTDITREADVLKWQKFVEASVGKNGLDILINNAGVLTPGPMELLKIVDIRKEFEVNVFGSLMVTQAFLPLLRLAKGRILQIGSLTGRFAIPFSGPSSASKGTLEAFADVYRNELRPFGVDYILVQAGNMLTGGPTKTAALLQKVQDTMTPDQQKLYGDRFQRFAVQLNKMQSEGLSARKAAERVIEISELAPAPARATVGDDAKEILQMVREKSDEEIDLFRSRLLDIEN